MKHDTGLYPRLHVDTAGSAAVGQAGGVVLVETIRTAGFDELMSVLLRPWRKPLAIQARSCSIWRSRWLWAVTVWPM